MATDTEIIHKAKEALAEDEGTKALELHLKVIDGVVFLDGRVDTAEQKAHAQEVISKIEGVVYVKNRIRVEAVEEIEGTEDWRRSHEHE